nr:ATP-binding protein [Deinococcus sp. HSC-46F16]
MVSAVTLGTVGLISAATTRSEFNALLGAQAREALAAEVQAYVRESGTVSGFRPTPPARQDGENGPPQPGPGNGNREVRSPWLVLDPQRRAVFPTRDVPQGGQVSGRPETPVTLNGEVVAYVVPSGMGLTPDRRGEEFLARTVSAIGWAMLGATLLAAAMGLLLSRTLLRPLRELLGGIRTLQRGQEPAPMRVARRDEFGEVLTAFGEMHREVVRQQQARRQLTADIAHDLNTPLSVIAGTLEAILDGTFKPTPERLGRLHRETQHVAQLVNDLRFLSLADAGELPIHRQPTDLGEVITEAVGNVREVAAQKGVALRAAVPSVTLTADLDRVRIRQVIHNLLNNALAHTPPGGEVTVQAQAGPQGLRVTVQDTGSGIAPEHLPHVFGRLYRADPSRSVGGSGLGLSICKSIVEAHGGHIELSSAPDQGTAVTFTVPLT